MPYFCTVKKTLLVITLFILFKPILPLVEYVVDYEYISKVLCINKEKPELKCNGKCHLKQSLANASEEEKPISDKKHTAKEIEILFFQEIIPITFSKKPLSAKPVINCHYANLYHYLDSQSFFHPPAQIV